MQARPPWCDESTVKTSPPSAPLWGSTSRRCSSKGAQHARQLHPTAVAAQQQQTCHAYGCVSETALGSPTLHTHHLLSCCRYKLNIWDVGGQKTLRPYWRNYYEKTDGLIWVVDAADLARLEDCKKELHSLLQEERLFGATLLILANKQDIPSALSLEEIAKVRGSCATADGLQTPQGMASGRLGVGQDKQVGNRRACAGQPLVAAAAAGSPCSVVVLPVLACLFPAAGVPQAT